MSHDASLWNFNSSGSWRRQISENIIETTIHLKGCKYLGKGPNISWTLGSEDEKVKTTPVGEKGINNKVKSVKNVKWEANVFDNITTQTMSKRIRKERNEEFFYVWQINDCLDYIYTINSPIKENGWIKCIEAKKLEMETLKNFGQG